MVFPASGPVITWELTEKWLGYAKGAFPDVDVIADLRLALAKIQTGAARKPTAKGMPRFLMGWLGRTNDRQYQSARGSPPRDIRVGHGRAEDANHKHTKTGEVPI